MIKRARHSLRCLRIIGFVGWLALFDLSTYAANQYFSGTGAWDATTTADWGTTTGGPYTAKWTSASTAIFEGTAGTVSVSGTDIPTVGGINFNVTGYKLSGGTLTIGANPLIINQYGSGVNFEIDSVIANGSGANTGVAYNRSGSSRGTITIGGLNTYTGPTTNGSSIVSINTIANGGSPSSFGAGDNTVPVVICTGTSYAQVNYTGTGGSTDRPWLVGGSGGGTINNNGSGALSFNNTGSMMVGTAGARPIALGGSYAASANTFAETINDLGTGANISALTVNGGTWIISGANTFSGTVQISGSATLSASSLNYVTSGSLSPNTSSSLGHPSAANGPIQLGNTVSYQGGTLRYVGPGETTDRAINLANTTGGSALDQSGTGLLKFTSAFTATGAGSKTLTLQGSTAGTGEIDGAIVDNSTGTYNTALTKAGTGIWTLSGANSYTGATTVSGGTLLVSGSIGTNSVTVVNSGTVLGGSGTIGGNVTFALGTLATNNEGSPLTISGSLTLNNNTLKVATPSALGAGDYTLITYNITGSSGSFNPTPVISGAGLAANTTGTIITGGGLVKLHVVLNTQPTTLALDSSLNASTYGQTVTFTAAVKTNSVTAGNATSNVVFSVDGTPVTTNSLSGGQATYVTSLLTVPSHTIGAIYVGDANYLPSTNSLTQTVNPAPLGITANNTNKTYNGVPFAGGNGVTYSGFENGETPAVLGGSLSYGGSSQGATNAGSYIITPLGQTSSNYAISYTNGTLTISPASTSVGAISTNNPCGYKDHVAFLATLPTYATGSVVFSSTNGAISTNILSSGSATSLSITNLPRGTNLITVAYMGDGNYVGSTNTLNQIVTNHPPVANPATYTRSVAINQIRIAVTNLLSNVSDGDGDNLALDSVGATTNAANLVVSGGWVMYYNTNAVADEFTYTVSDGYGGTNSATVTITVDSTPLFGQSTLASTTGGTATLNFAGIPTYSYSVMRSTNLSSWAELWTTNAPASGLFQYIDLAAPQPSAYYRLQYNP